MLATLEQGQYFGEEDIMENKNRSFTATCTTHKTVLYVLTKQKLLKIFANYPQLEKILRRKLELKEFWREKQLENYEEANHIRQFIIKKASNHPILPHVLCKRDPEKPPIDFKIFDEKLGHIFEDNASRLKDQKPKPLFFQKYKDKSPGTLVRGSPKANPPLTINYEDNNKIAKISAIVDENEKTLNERTGKKAVFDIRHQIKSEQRLRSIHYQPPQKRLDESVKIMLAEKSLVYEQTVNIHTLNMKNLMKSEKHKRSASAKVMDRPGCNDSVTIKRIIARREVHQSPDVSSNFNLFPSLRGTPVSQ